jgi:formamidopyrimidine-DNA glycosylase
VAGEAGLRPARADTVQGREVPEFPEVEALRRALDDPVRAFPVRKAGPAHVATLKTYDPPLAALEGRRFAGAERIGKNVLFPTDEGELVLHVHLMSAGRLRYLRFGEKQPKTPAFRLTFEDGSSLVLTEGGHKKRAKVGVYTPAAIQAELSHIGPDAFGIGADRLGEILHADSRRLHAFLRDQRGISGIGRAWANEILLMARLSPYALTTELDEEEVQRLAAAIDEELGRGLELRERGASDKAAYRIHDRLGEPCPVCGTPIARVDFDEHTIYYCPTCQTEGRILKDRRLSRLLR